ncbi:Cyclopropane-fatty-acyl-phospholipid synthase [Altererythrobacter insulae]|nr:Cyclopropane-fatty-acyl-phospholipid synthase [Altererythrobacter insulae]
MSSDNSRSFKGAGKSLAIVAIAAALGLGFAYLLGDNSLVTDGYSLIFACAVVAFAVNWIAYVPSAIAQKDTYYDTVGALTYLSVIGYAAYHAAPLDTRAIVVAIMVGIWTIRLGSFLFVRIHNSGGGDKRFEKIKRNPARFLVAWTLQANWVIFTASAALVVITAAQPAQIGIFFWIGSAVWLIGLTFEVVADEQKRRFKADPANDGDFIQSGLWAWSQHPNYFGEITLWTGILIIALPLLSGWSWLAIISPIFVYFLLTRVSGINLLDGLGDSRWGDDPEYQAYRKRTPKLFPRPPMA